MTDEPEPEEAPSNLSDEDAETGANPLGPSIRSALQAFRQQQRLLASYDFTPLGRIQDMIGPVSGVMQAVKAAQESVDFNALQAVAESVQRISSLTGSRQVDPDMIAQLASSIDISAIKQANNLIIENAAIFDVTRRQAEQFAAIAAKFDYSALVKQFSRALAGINWDQLRTIFERVLPSNLRSVGDLVAVAAFALNEGLPLAWVPRPEILDELVSAATAEDRVAILDRHADDIMDDCDAVLKDIAHEWAEQCRLAIRSFRHDLEAPAQSHASNIIDSIVYTVLGKTGRDDAKKRAHEDYGDLPIHVAVENLVLRPLFLGFAKWYPGGTDPIPDHFARHTTAHAVGQPGVFSRRNALVAVMLATSLTAHFWDDPAAP